MSTDEEITAAVLGGQSGPRIGAFFDFDGTVIDGYSALAVYRHRLRNFEMGPEELARTLLFGIKGGRDEEEFERLVEMSLSTWRGRSEDELDELGERLFVQGIAGSLYPEAWALVHAHKRMGHTVVLASSATRFQIAPMARELGVEHLLCTPIEAENGILTGRAGGRVLWGSGKADAVRAFAEESGIDLQSSFAYSNGDEDIEFLETVGNPVAVNAQKQLARVAASRGWPTASFAPRGRPGLPTIARSAAAYWGMAAGFSTGVGVALLSRNRRRGAELGLSLGSELALAIAGADLDVIGSEHLFAARPAVFITNHQSPLDPLVVGKLLHGQFTGVVKKEVASIPVAGQFLRFADFAFLDRADSTKARAALEPAVERLRAGISIAIAPEGTRSYTPRLGKFKKGAFHMAMQAGVPIVPIAIRNAGELAPRNSVSIRGGQIQVVVHPPISVQDWDPENLDAHVADVRRLFLETLADWPVRTQLTPGGGAAAVPLETARSGA